MTEEEFQFWKAAYIGVLTGSSALPDASPNQVIEFAEYCADKSIYSYRAAKRNLQDAPA